ncbi:MAG: leucine-rich repeat protein [Clostridiaceae bacterium]|nr:leucine-rich repeat protein [Clostridiaceae bacterium]
MRKQFKSTMSMVLSAAMVLTGAGVSSLTASTADAAGTVTADISTKGLSGVDLVGTADNFNLYLYCQDNSFGNLEQGTTTVNVTGNGEYTLSYDITADGTFGGVNAGSSSENWGSIWVDADFNVPYVEGGNIRNPENNVVFTIDALSVIRGTETYTYTINKEPYDDYQYADNKGANGMRAMVLNPWGDVVAEDGVTTLRGYVTSGKKSTENFYNLEEINVKTGDQFVVHISVDGMATDNVNTNTSTSETDTSYLQNFAATLNYSADAKGTDDGSVKVNVVGDGDYVATYTAKADTDDIYSAVLDTNLYGDTANIVTGSAFTVQPTAVRVAASTASAGSVYTVDASKTTWSKKTESAAWSSAIRDPEADTAVDALSEQKVAVKAGEVVMVYFTVSGTGLTSKTATASPTTLATEAPTAQPATEAPTASPQPTAASTYHGYIGFQTDQWSYRDAVNGAGGLASTDYDFLTQVMVNAGDVGKTTVTIADAEMTENGVEYTAKISGMNLQELEMTGKKSIGYKMLYLSTDIPTSMTGVSITNATLKIDGNVVTTYDVMPTKSDQDDTNGKCYMFMFVDAYESTTYTDASGTTQALGREEVTNTAGDTYIGLLKDGSSLKTIPTDSIEITYTVTGVDFASSADQYTAQTLGTEKGKTFTSGNYKYKVTTAATTLAGTVTAGKVQVAALSAAGKKKTSLSVPKTVSQTVDGTKVTYKVTSVSAKAFSSNKKVKTISFSKATNLKKLPSKAFYKSTKLTTVTFGSKIKSIPANAFSGCTALTKLTLNKNMTKIPKNAFTNCKKLSKLTLSVKLKSVAKNAFKGCKKKITVSAKSSVKKASLKKLKASGYKKFK